MYLPIKDHDCGSSVNDLSFWILYTSPFFIALRYWMNIHPYPYGGLEFEH